ANFTMDYLRPSLGNRDSWPPRPDLADDTNWGMKVANDWLNQDRHRAQCGLPHCAEVALQNKESQDLLQPNPAWRRNCVLFPWGSQFRTGMASRGEGAEKKRRTSGRLGKHLEETSSGD